MIMQHVLSTPIVATTTLLPLRPTVGRLFHTRLAISPTAMFSNVGCMASQPICSLAKTNTPPETKASSETKRYDGVTQYKRSVAQQDFETTATEPNRTSQGRTSGHDAIHAKTSGRDSSSLRNRWKRGWLADPLYASRGRISSRNIHTITPDITHASSNTGEARRDEIGIAVGAAVPMGLFIAGWILKCFEVDKKFRRWLAGRKAGPPNDVEQGGVAGGEFIVQVVDTFFGSSGQSPLRMLLMCSPKVYRMHT